MDQTLLKSGRPGVWTEVNSLTSTRGVAYSCSEHFSPYDFSMGLQGGRSPLTVTVPFSGAQRYAGGLHNAYAGGDLTMAGSSGAPVFAGYFPTTKQPVIGTIDLTGFIHGLKKDPLLPTITLLFSETFHPCLEEANEAASGQLVAPVRRSEQDVWVLARIPFAGLLKEKTTCSSSATTQGPANDFAEVIAKRALPQLESARSPTERRQVFRNLTRFSSPEAVVQAAFKEYDRTGREAFLLHAVALLEAFKTWAWPSLLRLAQSERPEIELFLGLIARCKGVSKKQRSDAFRYLARHGSASVRLGLLEHLAALPLEEERAILLELAAKDPNDGVKADASVRLSALLESVQ